MPIYTVTYCMKWRRTVFWNETFYKGSLGWQQVWEIPLVIEETLFATTSHPLLIITKFPGLPKCYIAPLQRKELSALSENDWFISATWSLPPSLSLSPSLRLCRIRFAKDGRSTLENVSEDIGPWSRPVRPMVLHYPPPSQAYRCKSVDGNEWKKHLKTS